MDKKMIAPHIDELNMALDDVSREKICIELERLLEYRVPLKEAKKTLINKYSSSGYIKVKDLSAGLNGIEIKGRIIDIDKKSVSVQGENKNIFSGTFGDGTGICSFTCWDDLSLKPGDAINIKNAYTRLWNNRPELYFGKRAKITFLKDAEIPNTDKIAHTNFKKLEEIVPADVLVSSVVIIEEMYHRELIIKDQELVVIEGVIADETAKLPFTSWIDLGTLDIGDYMSIKGASVKMFRGLPSININERTTVESIENKECIPFTMESVKKAGSPVSIEKVLEKDGIFDVTVKGNIISVRSGSGIIERCPVCNRVTQKSLCRSHGEVECLMDMRIKAILDDGTGAVHLMLNRELSEAIYGKSMHDAEKIAKESISNNVVFDDMRKKLTGKYLAARGNSSRNEFGVSVVARSVWIPEDDILENIDRLLDTFETGCDE